MFHPNLGRWLQNDPIGFDAGDMNLYRVVHNSPPTGLDPNGLWDVVNPGVTHGRKLANNPVSIKGNECTIRVNTDVTLNFPIIGNQKGYSTITASMATGSCKECHWVQLARAEIRGEKDAVSREKGFGIDLRKYTDKNNPKERKTFYIPYDATVLDTSYSFWPYYDYETNDNTNRSDSSLDIADRPRLGPVIGGIEEKRIVFDAYFVCGGKAYYHVHWEMSFKAGKDAEYEKVSGEKVSDLPAFLKRKWLLVGFTDPSRENPHMVENPLWSSE